MGLELTNNISVMEEEDNDLVISDSDLVYHIRDALRSATQGNRVDYDQLLVVIHHKDHLTPDDVGRLEASLKGLSGAVASIDIEHHKSLLASIFSMSMWIYDPHVMDALVELIISLAASNGKYIDLCLEMLVRNFTPPPSFLGLLKQPRGLTRKQQVLSRVHSALKDIADLLPLSPLILAEKVVQKMQLVSPKKESPTEIVMYVENMLKLESGAIGAVVGKTMLMAVVDKLIDLDVEIGWDDILQDDSSKGIFEMEFDDAEEDDNEFSSLSLSRKNLGGNSTAEALDNLMVLIFEHLEACASGGRLIEVFDTLFQSFEKTVLNTYKSKFAQFVMFYACALDPYNCGQKFPTKLVDIFFYDAVPQNRMSAAAYLASYVSRAVFVPDSFVVSILKRLVDWCFAYCSAQDGEINPEVHRVFYSGCQAVMYILCFRMRAVMANSRLKSQLVLMPLEPVLKHRLNPLKVCLPSVVKEFLGQAKREGLFTVLNIFIFDDLLESELSRAYGGLERLDMFFPFDPCLLKQSDRYLKPNYKYWSMVRAHEDDSSADEDEDEDEDDVVVDWYGGDIKDSGIAKSFDDDVLDLDEFDNALNKMSITPKPMSYRFGGEVLEPMQMPSRIRPSTSPESL